MVERVSIAWLVQDVCNLDPPSDDTVLGDLLAERPMNYRPSVSKQSQEVWTQYVDNHQLSRVS